MNEFEKALDEIVFNLSYHNDVGKLEIESYKELKIIQELVDKETPMEWLYDKKGYRKCGNCENRLHLRELSTRCDVCGQVFKKGNNND